MKEIVLNIFKEIGGSAGGKYNQDVWKHMPLGHIMTIPMHELFFLSVESGHNNKVLILHVSAGT